MELEFDTALINASAAARLAGGRGRELLIHANATTNPLYTPGTMIIIARYLGPVVVVAAARIKAQIAKQRGIVTWKKRSPVRSISYQCVCSLLGGREFLPACHEFKKVEITART
jgi:hypothetical protein